MISRVYLCGRISGRCPKGCAEAFSEREAYWSAMGFEVVNPLKVTPYAPGKAWEEYMKDCLEVLVRCDYIAPEDGWGNSKGSCIEMRLARELSIGVL